MKLLLLALMLIVSQIEIDASTDRQSVTEFKVSISVNYTPPSTFHYVAPYYRAASPLSLTCEVEGISGEGVFYEWRSTCAGNCFAARRTSKTVSTQYLHSYDSGVHTCIVYDGLGCSGNTSVTIHVSGAGIYVTSGQRALPNNGLIVAGVTNRISEFRCLSGSSSPYVGQLLSPNGEDLTHIDTDHFLVHRGGSYDPGLVHVRRLTPLAREEQGMYTCRIPNERGIAVDVNVGMYLQDSAGPPVIESLEYGVNQDGLYIIKCTSSGSPPTKVTWTRNDAIIDQNDGMYKPTQTLVNRTKTVYENVLTVDGSFEDAIGEYSCTVENSLGKSETVNRTIKSLEITGHSKPIIVGLSGTINCSTLLNVSKLEWFISGIKDLSESREGAKFITLSLTPQTTAWNGTSITCRATTYDDDIYEESINIIVKDLENTIRIEGTSNPWLAGRSGYSLTCVVTADIAPEVKWKDGNNNQISTTDSASSVFVSEPVISGRTTRLTLNFSLLRTSHGASYSCLSVITVPASVQVGLRDVIVKIPPPTVRVVRQPNRTQFFTTESVDLVCLSDINLAVDTQISVDMNWSGPSGNRMRSDGRTSVLGDRGTFTEHDSTLQFSSLRSSDTGTYTCSSVASSTSRYVVSSSTTSAANSINAALKTIITISYTPPDQYPMYSPPSYRAASSVTLSCSAQGASGSVRYRWTSTCSSCFASSSTSSTISENMLRSRDAGIHTCTATDSSGNTGSNNTTMNIYGAGIYVTFSYYGYAGRQAAQPDNTYINVDSGYRRSSSTRFALYCCSNSTASYVGSIIAPNEYVYTSRSGDMYVTRYGSSQSNTGCIYLYGYERNRFYYTSGVYTCNIPDANGQYLSVNFSLYDESYRPTPSISQFQRVSSSSALTFICDTRYAPPTEITWRKNGVNISIDGNTTRMSHRITNRYYSYSYYRNTLSIYGDPNEMAGSYTCSYGNQYSTHVTSSSITIQGIQLSGDSSNFAIGQRTSFGCSSDLDLTRVQWYRNGSLITNTYGSQGRVNLGTVTTDDQGTIYTCKTVSPYGSQERNVTVNVQVPSSWATIEITNTTKGDALHNHTYALVCTVRLMTGLRIVPDVDWYSTDGSVIAGTNEHITATKIYSSSSSVITHIITFTPVLHDDGGVYLCRAQVTVPWMTTQPPVKQASVNMAVTSQAIFQLQMGPLSHCSNWEASKAEDLEESIKENIQQAIRQHCSCNFLSSAIHSGEFSCQTTTTDVIYRAIINGTSDLRKANELLSYIEDWRHNRGTLLYNKFRLRLSQHCPLQIESFDEVECMRNETIEEGHDGKEQDSKSDKGKTNLMLGGGSCYKFQACDDDSDTATGSGDN